MHPHTLLASALLGGHLPFERELLAPASDGGGGGGGDLRDEIERMRGEIAKWKAEIGQSQSDLAKAQSDVVTAKRGHHVYLLHTALRQDLVREGVNGEMLVDALALIDDAIGPSLRFDDDGQFTASYRGADVLNPRAIAQEFVKHRPGFLVAVAKKASEPKGPPPLTEDDMNHHELMQRHYLEERRRGAEPTRSTSVPLSADEMNAGSLLQRGWAETRDPERPSRVAYDPIAEDDTNTTSLIAHGLRAGRTPAR